MEKPDWLRRYCGRLLHDVAPIEQKEVRWHVAQMLGRVLLTPRQRERALELLEEYLCSSDSQIVKVSALQALADLAKLDRSLRPKVLRLIKAAMRSGSPSLKARARKLLG